MTTKNFNVKVGITTGNITLDAATGNANVSNINVSGIATTANLSVLGLLKSNLIPNGNGVLSLANATSRYKDFYLAGNIDINGHVLSADENGLVTDKISINDANINTVTVNNQLIINSSTDSISATTGSLITAGGVGIKKDLTVGGNINLAAEGTTQTGSINYNYTASSIDFKFNE
jgi:hypothetical protein